MTGAAGMLGYYSARTFAEAGADLALVDLPVCEEKLKERAQELENEYGIKANYYCANLTDEAAVDQMFKNIDNEMDGIDIVHSNAGVGGTRTPDYETPLADYMRVLNGSLNSGSSGGSRERWILHPLPILIPKTNSDSTWSTVTVRRPTRFRTVTMNIFIRNKVKR